MHYSFRTSSAKGDMIWGRLPAFRCFYLPILAIVLTILPAAGTVRAAAIDQVVVGPVFALTKLAVEGVDFGDNFLNHLGGRNENLPWSFVFADGTYAPQEFDSDVGIVGGLASANAVSDGWFGVAGSWGLANGATKNINVQTKTWGIASANSLAGFGEEYHQVLPVPQALVFHIATIIVDPLGADLSTPISQPAPPDPEGFDPVDPDFFRPSVANINAYAQNSFGEQYSLFQFEASLGYDDTSGLWDELFLSETGPGGVPSSLLNDSLFSPYASPEGGAGWELTSGTTLTIPYSLPTAFHTDSAVVFEIFSSAASAVTPVPEPATLLLALLGLVCLGVRPRRGR